jgi:hypothetical protein
MVSAVDACSCSSRARARISAFSITLPFVLKPDAEREVCVGIGPAPCLSLLPTWWIDLAVRFRLRGQERAVWERDSLV